MKILLGLISLTVLTTSILAQHDSTIIHKMTQYPGGQEALIKYLSENLQYPETALKDKVEGRVLLAIEVTIEGEIVDIQVKEGVREDLDKEAVRVARSMPNWTAGEMTGPPVPIKFHLPIRYTLPKKKKKKKK